MKPQEAWERHKELSELFSPALSADEEERAYKHFMRGFICGEKHQAQVVARKLAEIAGVSE